MLHSSRRDLEIAAIARNRRNRKKPEPALRRRGATQTWRSLRVFGSLSWLGVAAVVPIPAIPRDCGDYGDLLDSSSSMRVQSVKFACEEGLSLPWPQQLQEPRILFTGWRWRSHPVWVQPAAASWRSIFPGLKMYFM